MSAVAFPHEVLGVAAGASPAEVNDAYRRLAEIYHPDRYATARPQVQQEAARKMRELNQARDALLAPPASSTNQDGSHPPPPPPPRPRTPSPHPGAQGDPPQRQAALLALCVLLLLIVVVAVGALLLGIFSDNLALIFVSIAASASVVPVLLVLGVTAARSRKSIG